MCRLQDKDEYFGPSPGLGERCSRLSPAAGPAAGTANPKLARAKRGKGGKFHPEPLQSRPPGRSEDFFWAVGRKTSKIVTPGRKAVMEGIACRERPEKLFIYRYANSMWER